MSLVPGYLQSHWDIEVADPDDVRAFEHALGRADAMVSMNWRWNVAAASHLKLLQLPGAGTDQIDFSRVPQSTTVCNCFEHEIAIAEYVIGAMLESVVGISRMDQALRRGSWAGSYLFGPRHEELHGKTLGILGFGHIGREVAQRARAFGMRVMCCTRTPQPDALTDWIRGMDSLTELLSASDFVLVTLPLTDETRGLFGGPAFSLMRPSAVIINVSRGAVVDEEALYTALKDRRIRGAIIDVWYSYPPRDQPHGTRPSSFAFHELDNVMMTPHASGWTYGVLRRRNRAIAMNLDRLARGEPLHNVVRAATESRSPPVAT